MRTDKLSSMEWQTLWMAIRYAVGRKTIACSSLPGGIAREYVHRLNDQQKVMIVKDIRSEIEMCRGFARDEMWEGIDAPEWEALADSLDTKKHHQIVTDFEGKKQTHTAFLNDGRWVSVSDYHRTGRRNYTINPDYIIQQPTL